MTTRTFDSAPASLPIYLRAALPAIPLIGSLPGIKHASGSIPDLVVVREGVKTDPDHLEAYNEVCGFATTDTLPVTYPHLAGFGLQMTLMTDTGFPFTPMGLVHLRNRITQHRPLTRSDVLDIRVTAADLRPHPKGMLADILTEITVEGEPVWDEVMTVFSRGKGGNVELTEPPLDGVEAPRGVVHWKAASNLGRRYAAVSGDRNPIHLHPLTARAFGFRSNIAHGMWTKARAMAALQSRLPDAFNVDVEFKKPILLPATVVFGSTHHGAVTTFGVVGTKKAATHLVGQVTAT